MKKKLFHLVSLFLIFMMACTCVSYAHSGRTDSQGGHHDYKNASGLGSYHYHCGGYPAHLHPGGHCPYAGGGSTASSTSKPKIKPITTPTITVKSVNANYLKITWSKHSKAKKYYIYRSVSKNGTYKKIAATTNAYYKDKTVKNKTVYYYKVKAIGKSSKYNSKLSAAKSGKIQFNGKLQLSARNVSLTPSADTYVVRVKATGTKDDIIAYYDDELIDIEWGEQDEDGWYSLTLYSYIDEEDYGYGEETEIELVFGNHKRLYKAVITVTFDDDEYLFDTVPFVPAA